MRKSSNRFEALAEEVRTKALPALETSQSMLTELRPKFQTISDNLMETTGTVLAQVQRLDASVTDVVDRARLQVIRTDELVTRTLDRVEATSDLVEKTVVSPVRQVSGVIQGITAGLEFLLSRGRSNGRTRESRRAVQQDEMFI